MCVGYYLLMGCTLHRWNSTFARFWPGLGVFFFFLAFLQGVLPERGAFLIRAGVCVGLVIMLALILAVLTGMRPWRERELPWLVVLGAHVAGVRVTDSLERRLLVAAGYLKRHPETKVVVSGGQGEGEDITEAEAMEEYLIRRGIDRERIFCEDQSATTRENLEFSAAYIKDLSLSVGIVTSHYHMYRACRYARRAGYQDLGRLCAGCLPVLFVNYMVREALAVLKLWLAG